MHNGRKFPLRRQLCYGHMIAWMSHVKTALVFVADCTVKAR